MHEIQNILLLVACVAGLAPLATKLNLAEPILFVIGGVVLGLIPGFPSIPLDPEVIFYLFLPPLLYLQAYFTSWRDFKRNIRPITLLAVGLVLFTSAGVAYVCHWLIPDMPLAAGFVLGAIVSPPDAVAVAAVARQLHLPRRLVTILEGESLVNDASGLVALKFALAALASGTFSAGDATLKFLWVALGGIGLGLGLGWLCGRIFCRLMDDSLAVLVSLLVPFAAYLPAEHLGVSGVLAVVTTGLWLGWELSSRIPFSIRLKGNATWRMIEYLLNGLIFLLIGLQLRFVIADLKSDYSWQQLGWYALLVSGVVILLRPLWVFPIVYGQRLLFPKATRNEPTPPVRSVAVLSWAGVRGVVSLAAALALPPNLKGGIPFPNRELIVFLTFAVIIATLVVQGLSFPAVVRFLGVRETQYGPQQERESRDKVNRAALAAIDRATASGGYAERTVRAVRDDYDDRLAKHNDLLAEVLGWSERLEHGIGVRRLREAAIAAERTELLRQRRTGEISEELLHQIENELDLEEARLRS
jgi:CPA1 family monovalent cation:H+ antiporter